MDVLKTNDGINFDDLKLLTHVVAQLDRRDRLLID